MIPPSAGLKDSGLVYSTDFIAKYLRQAALF